MRRTITVKIVCAWCGKDMGEKPPYDDDKEVTHAICPACRQQLKRKKEKDKNGS